MTIVGALLPCVVPLAAMAQPVKPLSVRSKLNFHAQSVSSPLPSAETAAYAEIPQGLGSPREWRQDGGAYGKSLASALGGSAINGALGFGLDSALYGTIFTRTDSGGEILSTWRLGGDYGVAFLSNEWYGERLNTAHLGVLQGSIHLGFDFFSNLAAEFCPDVRRKTLRRKP